MSRPEGARRDKAHQQANQIIRESRIELTVKLADAETAVALVLASGTMEGEEREMREKENTKGIKRRSFFSLSRAFGTPVHHTPSRSTSKSQPTVVKQYNNND